MDYRNFRILYNALMVVYSFIQAKNICYTLYFSAFKVSNSFGITEFLINYQGGFVRRGLLGEILYLLETQLNIDISIVIGFICCISAFTLLSILIYLCIKKDVCWWIIPLSFSFCGLEMIRKDCLCFLIVIALIYVLKQQFKKTSIKIITLCLLSFLLLNLHEAFFFVIIPFLTYYILYLDKQFYSYKEKLICVMPIWLMFFILCNFHGDSRTVEAISSSWNEIYPCIPKVGDANWSDMTSIAAIGWNSVDTIRYHLNIMYFNNLWRFSPSGYVVLPIVYFLIYFITTRLICKFCNNGDTKSESNPSLSLLMIFQFISLSPMFFGLSCDTLRICSYWVLSTILIYMVLGKDKTMVLFSKNCVCRIERFDILLNRFTGINKTNIFFFIVISFLGVGYGFGGFLWIYSNSMVGSIVSNLSHFF